MSKTYEQLLDEEREKAYAVRRQRHRGSDPRNEHVLDNPPVPVKGGPHDGAVLHQPNEVAEVEMPGPDGKMHKYRRERVGRGPEGDHYAHAGEVVETPQQKLHKAVAAQDWGLAAQLAADLAGTKSNGN